MSPQVIFITGASGYIGGEVVDVMSKKHPEWTLITLVRDAEQAKLVKGKYPAVETVIGTLDDHNLLVEEGKRADVVLQIASADHIEAGRSIIEGMSKGKKGHYIHVSGSGILHEVPNGYGNPSTKIYSDVDDVMEITSFDSTHVHRDIDASVIEAGIKFGIPTAIVSPVTIYGVGHGPIKTRSLQIPFLTQGILSRGKAFTIGEGCNIWDNIYITDLAEAFRILTEEALKPHGGKATWGREGYYFTATTDHKWVDVVKAIAKIAHERGAIPSEEIDKLTPEEASAIHPWAPLLWGGNCRSKGDRIHALGWKPIGPTVYESLPEMVDVEIKTLGKSVVATTF
ncbi:NAD(P)-binding Rossmann-fold containing protein [Coleophoma cylindrospora]|uniref:NAD(P)-binding Rossmann-fold containing protein n=1 Tax=Coleophoma cylindrospora TaxID=1849047 RepID=A0A3D8RP06_9HELO|nr:NAD(P)-binding Rossmann-fold containing protein [Coleophoma cylindrospora]